MRIELEQFGAARLVRRCVAEICGGSWFDGRRLWTFGVNGVPFPEAEDGATPLRRTLAAIASYAFAEPAFRAGGGTVVPRGEDRFRVRAPGGAELDALIDPAGHAVSAVVTPAGERVAGYGRPTRVGGATFALARNGPYETGPLDEAAARPGPLAAPSGPAVAYAGEGELALADEPVPIVPCRLAGRAARCLLDSGRDAQRDRPSAGRGARPGAARRAGDRGLRALLDRTGRAPARWRSGRPPSSGSSSRCCPRRAGSASTW